MRNDAHLNIEIPVAEFRKIPEGNWIIVSWNDKRVIAHHPDLSEALADAERRGRTDGVIMKNVNLDKYFIL
jgi:hypothetical protein